MAWLATALRNHPEIAIFLVLVLGHAVSRIRIGAFRLNAVIGVILAGVLVGQLGIKPPEALQWSFFVLFLLQSGMKPARSF